MKTLILTIAIFICFQTIYSQWYVDNLQQTDDIPASWPDRIQFFDNNTGWFSCPVHSDTLYKTTNGGVSWLGYTTVDTNRVSVLYFVNQMTGWAVGNRGKIVKTSNGGLNWMLQTSGVYSFLNDVNFWDTQNGFIVGSYDSTRVILKTTNSGTTWQKLVAPGNGRLFSVKMLSANVVYAVGDSGRIIYTTNGGANWENQISNTNATLRSIQFKNYGPVNIGWIAGKNGALLTTSNGGQNWISRSFNQVNFYGIFFSTYDTGYTVGQYGRIYKTINSGLNWSLQSVPLDTSVIIKDVFCINSQKVWASGYNYNLIYTTNGGGPVGIQPISNEVPTGFSLAQNYPNPFNPNTKIQFSISKSVFTKLTIYDITGRVMAILVNEDLKPGIYETDWDAFHRASGVYYYKLESDSYSETRRMVLLK